jgi:hypothetical protein
MNYAKFDKINLKTHPFLNEKWVQDRIAEDPIIIGLGDVVLKDKERCRSSRSLITRSRWESSI